MGVFITDGPGGVVLVWFGSVRFGSVLNFIPFGSVAVRLTVWFGSVRFSSVLNYSVRFCCGQAHNSVRCRSVPVGSDLACCVILGSAGVC